MNYKNLVYISAAIFFFAATICIGVFTYTHICKARVTCKIDKAMSISAYVDKDDVEAVGDLYALTLKGIKNGSDKRYD